MLGLLGASVVSGQIISRTGRYRVLPDRRAPAIAIVGMFLLSTMDAGHRSLASRALYMFVLGIGIGLVMQVLVLATQNAVAVARPRRGHLVGQLLPLHRRLVRRRPLRRDVQRPSRSTT